MSRKINPRRRPVNQHDLKRAKKTAQADAIQQCMAIIFTALKDKHGWSNNELRRLNGENQS